ncbi:hypothetical protein P5F65_13525 [Clostridium perfringens]|nr:hypothetical protein [Clostridium perfringens]ELC8402849.1 hypothetical protein [Clostridium perfringens]MDK0755010.1 hypothetical protein [Clostridium perfringens]MDK0758142.1 hypothetical protein [Clostridium perfringens]MDK0969259.1 hypothetical protein [Clostridium perfringens]
MSRNIKIELPTENLKDYFGFNKITINELKKSDFIKKISENKSYLYLIKTFGGIDKSGIKALLYENDIFCDIYIKDSFYHISDVIFIDDKNKFFSYEEI